IVQWNAVPQFNNTDANTFQIAIFENGTVEYRYQSITIQPAGDITIGVENESGTEATSFDATTLGSGPASLRVAFRNGQNNCGSTCPADYNGDGTVDPDDLADYIACYFSQPPCPQADFNSDGTPDPDDLADYIAAYFGPPC
ncbi:MAG: hypothetical protein JNK35_12655, partial [Phycisphaerae bacterium]|nr:hypothetical protein [Phycisphaerae bacterium]